MENDNHNKVKSILKIIGFICLPIGIVLLLCGTITFFRGDTSKFFLNFIGVPFVFIGAVCLITGFMRELNKYVADENTPVIADAARKVIDGTREETVKTAKAVRAEDKPVCHSCGMVNEIGANFCDNCGAPLNKICPECGEANDGDANFCRKCGAALKKVCPECGEENGCGAKFCRKCGKEL